MLKKFIRWLQSGDTKSDRYRQGYDEMQRLINTLPEKIAVNTMMKVSRDYANPYDAGMLDCWNEHVARQKPQRKSK
jgi:hypothetical protein